MGNKCSQMVTVTYSPLEVNHFYKQNTPDKSGQVIIVKTVALPSSSAIRTMVAEK